MSESTLTYVVVGPHHWGKADNLWAAFSNAELHTAGELHFVTIYKFKASPDDVVVTAYGSIEYPKGSKLKETTLNNPATLQGIIRKIASAYETVDHYEEQAVELLWDHIEST